MPNQFTEDLRLIIEQAQNETARRHGNYVDVEHLLLGLLRSHSGPAYDLLIEHGVDIDALYDQAASAVGMERPNPAPVRGLSRWSKALMERTVQEAHALRQSVLSSGHLLLGLMGENDGAVHETLSALPFTPEDVRAYLRAHAPQAARAGSVPPVVIMAGADAPSPGNEPEVVIVPVRPARAKRKAPSTPASPWANRLLVFVSLALLIAYIAFILPGNSLFTFVFVVVGWVFSVTLHEFSHALVAYIGGDYTVKDKGYLTFNPLKYTHPLLSIALPLLFLMMGGIGLPGGAVYIERHRLRNKWWGAAVSAAGPLSNLLLALVLASPFMLGLVEVDTITFNVLRGRPDGGASIWEDASLWSAVAFLAMLQITAVVFNLLPIPPLDGYGIIEPLLDDRTRAQFRQLGMYGIMLVFFAFWYIPALNKAFWDMVYDITNDLSIPGWLSSLGYLDFKFWDTRD